MTGAVSPHRAADLHWRNHVRILLVGLVVYCADVGWSAVAGTGYRGDLAWRVALAALGAALLGRLLVRRQVSRRWEVGGFVTLGVAFLGHLVVAAHALGVDAETLMSEGTWMYLVYLYAYYVFSARVASLFSLGLLGTSAALLGPWAVSGAADRAAALAPLLHFEAGGVVTLVVAHGLSSWKTALGREQERVREARRASLTDELTGLPNRRALQRRLTRAVAAARTAASGEGGARAADATFAVLMLDLDHFKRVNDRFGHRAGDAVLAEFSVLIRGALRDGDVVGRWGGEEFVVLAPGADAEAANRLAERLRRTVAEHGFAHGRQTVSLGVATYRPEDTSDTLLGRADRSLYRAKGAGRDRVAGAASADEAPEDEPPAGEAPPAGVAGSELRR